MAKFSYIVLCILLGVVAAKEVTRSKRQMSVYYMCGSYPNSYVSQFPCSNSGNGCGYSTCSGLSSYGVLPNSFYYPSNNCNTGCNNLNCNQYNGMWINGQYVAYNYGSNQYSPCASSCCSNNYNNYNNYNGFNGGYIQPVVGSIGLGNGPITVGGLFNGNNPITVGGQFGGNPISVGTIGSNLYSNGVGVCGGIEASSGYCNNGFCSDGMQCVRGNMCCRCAVGASNGVCSNGVGCSAGYTCTQNGYCCATTAFNGLQFRPCVNRQCPDNFECGSGDLCYPLGK